MDRFDEAKGYGMIGPDGGGSGGLLVYSTQVSGSGFRSPAEVEKVSYKAASRGAPRGGGDRVRDASQSAPEARQGRRGPS